MKAILLIGLLLNNLINKKVLYDKIVNYWSYFFTHFSCLLFQALLKYQKYAKPFLLGEIFGMFLLIGVMSIGQYYKEKESQALFNNKEIYKVHPKHIIIDSEKVDSIKIYKKK